MILLFHEEKLVFTPSKTGSSSVHYALTGRDGGRWMLNAEMYQHSNKVPERYEHYKRYLLVRNPYTRFQSMWGHHQRDCMAGKRDPGTIEQLAERCVNTDEWFFSNITDIYGDSGWEWYWQIEHIQDCLSQAGIPVWVPHINRNTFAKKDLSQEVVEILRPWAEPDCEAFNYNLR